MNAVNALLRQTQEEDFLTAVERANKWVEVARPVMMAVLRLDGEVMDALAELHHAEQRTYSEAKGYVTTARQNLEAMVEGIRDDFIADERKGNARSEDEAEAFDNFNDSLEEEVTDVRSFVKQVEREDYDAWMKGERR